MSSSCSSSRREGGGGGGVWPTRLHPAAAAFCLIRVADPIITLGPHAVCMQRFPAAYIMSVTLLVTTVSMYLSRHITEAVALTVR